MARIDELRLLTRVARLYYGAGARQPEIADTLGVSQATVSRLLKRAEREGIVRVTVTVPSGAFPELEEGLQRRYGLREVIVVDSPQDDDEIVLRELGSAAAYYVETTARNDDVIGISSWSATLLAMVDAMRPLPTSTRAHVVQILGGLGAPTAEGHAGHLTRRLAALAHGEAIFLPAPGVVGSPGAREVLFADRYVREALDAFGRVTLALVGIGSLEPSRLLASSGNVFQPEELDHLQRLGAVGDICLRFFDAAGRAVLSPLDERVVSMSLTQIGNVKRSVGICGGPRKFRAIQGALAGRLVNVLITDRFTAERLVGGPSSP
jgi:DNA-binding transcriptional regulator LsrR (DeoR family)